MHSFNFKSTLNGSVLPKTQNSKKKKTAIFTEVFGKWKFCFLDACAFQLN